MIVAGMSLLITIFAVAVYAAVRFEFGVSHKQQRVDLAKILLSRPTLCTNQRVGGSNFEVGSKMIKGQAQIRACPFFLNEISLLFMREPWMEQERKRILLSHFLF
jgi:hypothetical protein